MMMLNLIMMSIMMKAKTVADDDANDNFIDTNCYYGSDYDNDNVIMVMLRKLTIHMYMTGF